jgi:hypothetical protein
MCTDRLECEEEVPSVLEKLEPGDLILVQTPGWSFSLGRKLTQNPYDHVAIVVDQGQTLNIVNPRAVDVPTEHITEPHRAPLVLRPVWDSPEQVPLFIENINTFRDIAYDFQHAVMGICLVTMREWLGLSLRLKPLRNGTRKCICTEAIILSLIKSLPSFEEITEMALDYVALGFATTNDLLRIARNRPDLLREMK